MSGRGGGSATGPTLDTLTAVELAILRSLRELRYGSLEVVVHDGRVVQLERREKLRPGNDGALDPERAR